MYLCFHNKSTHVNWVFPKWISCNKFFIQFASSQAEIKAMTLTSIIELATIVWILDRHKVGLLMVCQSVSMFSFISSTNF